MRTDLAKRIGADAVERIQGTDGAIVAASYGHGWGCVEVYPSVDAALAGQAPLYLRETGSALDALHAMATWSLGAVPHGIRPAPGL